MILYEEMNAKIADVLSIGEDSEEGEWNIFIYAAEYIRHLQRENGDLKAKIRELVEETKHEAI